MPSQPPKPPEPSSAVRDLLALRLIATLGTVNADGTPLLTPIWYLYEAGRIYLPTGSGSHKVRNIRARPAVSVLIDQRRPDRHRWASATGTAVILEGDSSAEINARVRARYVSAAGEATYGKLIADYDDVTLVITPDRWRAWTPSALDRLAAEHRVAPGDLASWFESWD